MGLVLIFYYIKLSNEDKGTNTSSVNHNVTGSEQNSNKFEPLDSSSQSIHNIMQSDECATEQELIASSEKHKEFLSRLSDVFLTLDDCENYIKVLNVLANDFVKYQLQQGLVYRLDDNDFLFHITKCSDNSEEYDYGLRMLQGLTVQHLQKDAGNAAILSLKLLQEYYELVFDDRVQAYMDEFNALFEDTTSMISANILANQKTGTLPHDIKREERAKVLLALIGASAKTDLDTYNRITSMITQKFSVKERLQLEDAIKQYADYIFDTYLKEQVNTNFNYNEASDPKPYLKELDIENGLGNIQNGGQCAFYNGLIYFSNGVEGGKLYRVNDAISEKTMFSNQIKSANLQVIDNWLYFSSSNKIIRKKLIGDLEECLYTGEVNTFWICQNRIFYTNSSDQNRLYRMDLDGKNIVCYSSSAADKFYVDDSWIYYQSNPIRGTLDTVYHRISLDGKTEETLFKRKQITSYGLIVEGDWIYDYNHLGINRIKKDGSSEETIVSTWVSCMNLYKGWIYYSDRDKKGLYKTKTDGTQKTLINSSSFPASIVIINDWIYYILYKEVGAFVLKYVPYAYRMKIDGTSKQTL